MTTDDFRKNDDLVKNWRETLAKNETVKIVYQTMDESSPIYAEIPELAGQTAEYKLGYIKGYTNYHKTLAEMGKYSNPPAILKPTYGVVKQ